VYENHYQNCFFFHLHLPQKPRYEYCCVHVLLIICIITFLGFTDFPLPTQEICSITMHCKNHSGYGYGKHQHINARGYTHSTWVSAVSLPHIWIFLCHENHNKHWHLKDCVIAVIVMHIIIIDNKGGGGIVPQTVIQKVIWGSIIKRGSLKNL
jgi:hypothetical protein